MRDFLPVEKDGREVVLGAIRRTYLSHGFQEIETPALEDIDRLTSGQGGDNEKLAFRVMKRGAELESALAEATSASDNLADLGLRYDLTVPLTRYYATNRAKLPPVFKALQTGPVWRAERPQKGRYRQFVQCDIDIIGDSSELAEVELLNASLDALAAVGIANATIRVNHRVLLAGVLDRLGVAEPDRASAMITIDKLDKVGAEGVSAELGEKFGETVSAKASEWLATLASNLPVPAELASLFEVVQQRHPGRLRFDPTLVRGMGYYTGAIFEIEHPESGSSIGGGGRYDGMIGRWLGQDVPAVGISIGFERIMDLVPRQSISSGVVLVFDAEEAGTLPAALRVQAEGIALGHRVRLEQRPKKLNLLLDALRDQGFTEWATVSAQSPDFGSLERRSLTA